MADSALEKLGCTGCHSTDGLASRGPTLRGLAGSTRHVARDGKTVDVIADRAYLVRSITQPNAEIVIGYPVGTMPARSEADAQGLATEIETLAGPMQPPDRSFGLLSASALAFVILHVGLSSLPLRKRIVGAVGAVGFAGIYSVLVLVAFVGVIIGYRNAPFVALWMAPAALRWLPNVVMPLAFVLLVCALTTKNPTLGGKPGAPPVTDVVGIIRVTRHPMLWAFLLWACAHIPSNGDVRGLIVFASLGALATIGMFHIDTRRAALFPAEWAKVSTVTSLLPFAAIAQGRNKFVFREIGVARIVVGIVLWAAALHFHRTIVGLSPLP